MAGFRAIALGAVLGLIAALPTTAQQQIDLFGVNSATLEWSPASGPVTGYYVIVARNGGTPTLQGVATQTRATIESPYGGIVSVQVAAFGSSGVAGPVSAPSSAIHFNPPPPSTDPTPPPVDPDGPPDPGEAPGGGSGGEGGAPGETPVATRTRFDFNGDGLSDLLLRDPRSGALVLWEMQSNQVMAQSSLAHLPLPWSLEEPGDYDGDGTADLLWRNASTGQLIIWRIREGAAASGAGLEMGTATSDWTIAGRGDFDGDGRDDLVLARPQRGVVDILHMNGSQIVSRVAHDAPSDRWRVVATPDVDGDGTAELVWENVDSHALSIESMSGTAPAAPLVSPPGAWRVLDPATSTATASTTCSYASRRAEWRRGDSATGVRAADWHSATAGTNQAYDGFGDFDGDGRADSFWHDPNGSVEIWFSTEGGLEPAYASEMTGDDKPVGEPVD